MHSSGTGAYLGGAVVSRLRYMLACENAQFWDRCLPGWGSGKSSSLHVGLWECTVLGLVPTWVGQWLFIFATCWLVRMHSCGTGAYLGGVVVSHLRYMLACENAQFWDRCLPGWGSGKSSSLHVGLWECTVLGPVPTWVGQW